MGSASDYRVFNERLRDYCLFLHRLVPGDKYVKELYDNVVLGMQALPQYPMQLFWGRMQAVEPRVRAHDVTLFTENRSSFLKKIPIQRYLNESHITDEVRAEFWHRLNELVDYALLVHPTPEVVQVIRSASQYVMGNARGVTDKEALRDMVRSQSVSMLRQQRSAPQLDL